MLIKDGSKINDINDIVDDIIFDMAKQEEYYKFTDYDKIYKLGTTRFTFNTKARFGRFPIDTKLNKLFNCEYKKRIDNKTDKKISERHFLYRYLRLIDKLGVEVIDCESPDFIIREDENVLGVEIIEATTEAEKLIEKFLFNNYSQSEFEKMSKNKIERIPLSNGSNAYSPNTNKIDYSPIFKGIKTKLLKIPDYKFCDLYIILVVIQNILINPLQIKEELTKYIAGKTNNVRVVIMWNDEHSTDKYFEI